MKNNDITPVVAGNEDMAMPKEVEETLNQSNTEERKIKRGVEIETGIDGTIYALMYLKDCIRLAQKYYLDWTCWLEEETYKDMIIENLLESAEGQELTEEEKEDIENVEKFKQITFEKGLLKNTFSKMNMEVDNAITILKNNCSIDMFQFAVDNIENTFKKLDSITEYFCQRGLVDYVNIYCDFYCHIITLPVYQSLELVSEIIKNLRNVDKVWLEMRV